MDQLSEAEREAALAQLSEEEREVLLEVVEGTDICDRDVDIPAIIALCENRIETRSAEFRRPTPTSAEDRLLGGGLDSERIQTLENAISRLARNVGDSNDFSNQVIASVALDGVAPLPAAEPPRGGARVEDLTPETEALVSIIVQQLGGN